MKATLTNARQFYSALLLAAFVSVPIAEATKPQIIAPVGSPAALRAALTRRISIGMENEPIVRGMHRLSEWGGYNELLIDRDLLVMHINYSHPPMYGITVEEAVRSLRLAFKEQARVGWEDLPDGVMHFAGLKADGGIPSADMNNVRIIWRDRTTTVEAFLGRMKAWSGKEIRFESTAFAGLAPVRMNVGTAPLLAKEIFTSARAALFNAGIVLDEQPDGSYRARLAAKPAPAAPSAAPSPAAPAKQP